MKKALLRFKNINGPALDSLLLAFIQIVSYLTGIITTKILSVELSLTEYGTYSTVNSVFTIAASFTLFGLGDTINYYYNKQHSDTDTEDKEGYINTIFFVQLIVGVIVGLFLTVGSGLISDYYKNDLVKPLILIICLRPWISNATHLYQVLFVSVGKAKLIAIRNLLISIARVAIIYVATVLSNSLTVIFVCLVILDLVQLIAFKYIFGKIKFNVRIFAFCKDKIKPVIKYTVPMGIYFVTTTLMREIDKLVIGRLGTTEDLAIYSNCAKTLPLNILITAFATVLIPYIMKNVSGKNYELTAKILRKYLSIGYMSVWMFSGALLLCSSEAIQFFYSEEYISGLPIFVLYIIDGMIQFASVHLVIAANGDSKFLMKNSWVFLVANAILSVVLFKVFEQFGYALIGPALATVLISVVYVLSLYLKTSKILALKITAFLPVKHMLTYLCQLVLVGGVCYLAKYGMQLLNISWIVIFISICVAYCLILALINLKKYKQLFSDINELKKTNQASN